MATSWLCTTAVVLPQLWVDDVLEFNLTAGLHPHPFNSSLPASTLTAEDLQWIARGHFGVLNLWQDRIYYVLDLR